jgi:hypothetical protein
MKRREALKLLGAATTLPVLGQITAEELAALGTWLPSSRTTRPVTGQLTYLNAHQNATVTAIAELILPRTNTPGATDAGVNEFIDLIVGSWYSDRERGDFVAGLIDIDARSQARGTDFVDLDEADQIALLTELEAESFALREAQEDAFAAARGEGPYDFPTEDVPDSRMSAAPGAPGAATEGPPWNEHIFQRLKYLTLYGYYTSEEGAEELHFRIIPGEFKGCVPYEEIHGHSGRSGEPAGGSSRG